MAPILGVHFRNGSSWLVGQVLANSDLTDKLGVANLASISVRADILSALEVGLRFIPESGSASARDHRASSSDRCSSTLCEAAEAHARGSTLVGMALCRLAGLEFRGLHHESLHRCRLAPQGLWPVLDLEDSTRQPGRPSVPKQVRELIRTMSRDNPLWGAPRIHGELLKLGIEIGETSVSKYLVRTRKPPSQTWRTFLENHLQSLVSVDFFTVPSIRFQILYVFLVLAHDRRRILHFAVTGHPTAEWIAQQLREAFPWDSAPRYLLRD